MDMIPSLSSEMMSDAIVIAYLSNPSIAKDFYSALCNMQWAKIKILPEDELIIDVLKGTQYNISRYSWRGAGGIIADIRSKHHNVNEDYMDFYCLGNEGCVTDLVKECFYRMGWVPVPYVDDDL